MKTLQPITIHVCSKCVQEQEEWTIHIKKWEGYICRTKGCAFYCDDPPIGYYKRYGDDKLCEHDVMGRAQQITYQKFQQGIMRTILEFTINAHTKQNPILKIKS